ncbi:metal ABC transporter solute-binding protein, Zn/Mn family [Methylovirgula ligni]|nr:zinc ABC transporter substrate-binding protein [Methylovirgula ligni]
MRSPRGEGEHQASSISFWLQLSGGKHVRKLSISVVFAAMLTAGPVTTAFAASSVPINAIGVENEYADVISQVGGQYVRVQAVETDPNTDPHTFEASPKVAREIAAAQLIVENGVGYDAWADKIMSASARPNRKVINVQTLLGLPDNTANPHLWYDPKTMPAVAKAIAADLAALQPAQAAYFHANADKFIASLEPWNAAIAAFKVKYGQTPIAVTEPVADYMLEAMGFNILTPFSLQKAIMDGTDPAPQDVTTQNDLFATNRVKVFAYNQQVTDTLTKSFLDESRKAGIPVVGVYETMPTPGYTYQSWMLAEVAALEKALTNKVSTETLQK